MNANNAKDYLPLVQALAEGKTLQCQTLCKGTGIDKNGWYDVIGEMNLDCPAYMYRIKPEPRRWWIRFSQDNALVYTSKDSANSYNAIWPNPEIVEVIEVPHE